MTALSTSHAISRLTLDRQKLITSSTESNGFSAAAGAFKRIGELVSCALDGSGAMAIAEVSSPMERPRSMNQTSEYPSCRLLYQYTNTLRPQVRLKTTRSLMGWSLSGFVGRLMATINAPCFPLAGLVLLSACLRDALGRHQASRHHPLGISDDGSSDSNGY